MGSSNHSCHHPSSPGPVDPSQFEFNRLVHNSLKTDYPCHLQAVYRASVRRQAQMCGLRHEDHSSEGFHRGKMTVLE